MLIQTVVDFQSPMSESQPSAGANSDDSTRFHCEFTIDGSRKSYCHSSDSYTSAFDTAALGFLNELPTAEWDDVYRFAALLRDYSSLTDREIAGLLGIRIEEVSQHDEHSDPPWTLSHPVRDVPVRIRLWKD